MVGTEQEALAFAVTDCATSGREWSIIASDRRVIWNIERDEKVDEDDLTWPVIAHMRGSMGSDDIAVLVQVDAPVEG